MDPHTVYLLHFSQRYKHAAHYVGSTNNLTKRLREHEQGRGARLLEVVHVAGISWVLARTWEGGRTRERQLKKQAGASRFCPLCKAAQSTR
jgi:predicted GIY-YIG superfamily endonuclease